MPQRINKLAPSLKEWADWYLTASGYSDSTTIWRAMMASRTTEYTSSIPHGCIAPGYLSDICLGMNTLLEHPNYAKPITIMRQVYISDGVREACKVLKMTNRSVYRWKQLGEDALRNWLRVNQ